MASKISKNYSLKAKGILNVDMDTKIITLSVEDSGDVNLAELISDMNGMDVNITIGQTVEIA